MSLFIATMFCLILSAFVCSCAGYGVGTIISRCSGKGPAVFPERTKLKCRWDRRQRRKSSLLDLLARKMEKKGVIRRVIEKQSLVLWNLIDRQFCTGKYGIENWWYSGTPPYDHRVITVTLFWPEKKLSQSFSYLKNPFNTARFLWPIGDRITRVPLYRVSFLKPLHPACLSWGGIFHILLIMTLRLEY